MFATVASDSERLLFLLLTNNADTSGCKGGETMRVKVRSV